MYFQDLIMTLENYWKEKGAIIMQPYDIEKGAGTMNPNTFLRSLGPVEWKVVYVEPSRRPADGRYGENPNRLYQHHQLQVILKPSPEDVQQLYLDFNTREKCSYPKSNGYEGQEHGNHDDYYCNY